MAGLARIGTEKCSERGCGIWGFVYGSVVEFASYPDADVACILVWRGGGLDFGCVRQCVCSSPPTRMPVYRKVSMRFPRASSQTSCYVCLHLPLQSLSVLDLVFAAAVSHHMPHCSLFRYRTCRTRCRTCRTRTGPDHAGSGRLPPPAAAGAARADAAAAPHAGPAPLRGRGGGRRGVCGGWGDGKGRVVYTSSN